MTQESFLATSGLIVMRLIELHGIDPQEFMRQVGIDPALLRDPKGRMPSQLTDKVFAKATALIPDPAFALRAAECWHPSNLGSLGYAWLSSGTLRTGLKRLERFGRILGKMAYRCVDEPEALRFVFDHRRGDAPSAHAIADYGMSIIVDMCRKNFGIALNPQAVHLRRPLPTNPEPWQDFYRCPIRFGADEDSFVLPRRMAEMPLASANHEIAATFDAILTEQLAALIDTDVLSRCKVHLLQQLTSGEPSEQDLASALGMSRRTLQRRLGDLGLTYKGVVDGTRYELALRYLDDPERSVTDITFLLGFSEQSAFARAFKRWSGKAPTAYRSEHLAGV
jgi:AraC-like DNA-binding protein